MNPSIMRLLILCTSVFFSWLYAILHFAELKIDFHEDISLIFKNLSLSYSVWIWVGILFLWLFIFFLCAESSLVALKNELFIGRLSSIFYSILIFFYRELFFQDFLFLWGGFCFLLSSYSYYFFSYIQKYRKFFKYLSLFSSYISILLMGYLLYWANVFYWEKYVITLLLLLYSSAFQLFIHKKFGNYISLLFSFVSGGSVIYFLYFFLKNLYQQFF